MLFFAMLLAHLLADYPLQPTWLVMRKHQWRWLLVHGAVVFTTLLLLLWPLLSSVWSLLVLISGLHIIQDWLKLRLGAALFNAPLVPYCLDQAVHLMLLAACSLIPRLNTLEPPFPQSLYLFGILLVLIVWTFPITLRVARTQTILNNEE